MEKKQVFEQPVKLEVNVIDPDQADFDVLKKDIFELMKVNWGEKALEDPNFTPERVDELLKNTKNVNIILKTPEGKFIGYMMAIPDEDEPEGEAIYIESTDIYPDYQGKRLVGKLSRILEEEAKKRGYKYMTRDSAVGNGYADAIERYYKERIVSKRDHDSEYGLQRYFKIRL